MAPAKTLHIAVFLPTGRGTTALPSAQFLDTACVDILAMHDKTYIAELATMLPPGALPQEVLARTPDMRISYVGVGAGGEWISLTAALKTQLTHHFADAEVAPGVVDVVLVPGANPTLTWDPQALAWLKAQSETPGTDIISICTGIFICGAAGLLAGGKKMACGPRDMQELLAAQFQDVQWVGQELRWVRDGNFWSSGGVTNGNDAVAAYCRESGRFDPKIVGICLATAEVGDRPQRYDAGTVGAL